MLKKVNHRPRFIMCIINDTVTRCSKVCKVQVICNAGSLMNYNLTVNNLKSFLCKLICYRIATCLISSETVII